MTTLIAAKTITPKTIKKSTVSTKNDSFIRELFPINDNIISVRTASRKDNSLVINLLNITLKY